MRTILASLLLLAILGARSPVLGVTTGDVLVADTDLGLLEIDGSTQAVTTLVRSTHNGGSQIVWPRDVAVGPKGEIYVLDSGNSSPPTIWQVDPGSGAASQVTGSGLMMSPVSFAVGIDGVIYVADIGTSSSNGLVIKVDPGGGSQTVFSAGGQPYAVTVDRLGYIYVARMPGRAIECYTSSGGFQWAKSISDHTPAILTSDPNRVVSFGISTSGGSPQTYALDPISQSVAPLPLSTLNVPEGAAFLPTGDLVASIHGVIDVVVQIHADGTYGWRVGEYRQSPIGTPRGLAVFGVRDGVVPATPITWGRIKDLYRK